MTGHDHGPPTLVGNRHRLALVLAIMGGVLVAEVVGSIISGSLALLADAGHLFTDVAGLVLALVAAALAERPATDARTWGFRRLEVLAAAAQAAVLLIVSIFVVVQSIRHLIDPPGVDSGVMVVFGVVALVGCGTCILVLARSRSANLNMRAAFLEVASDALGALAVILAAIVVTATGWTRADAVASLLIGAFIVPRTVALLRETVHVLLEATPAGMQLSLVREHLLRMPHVNDVHDLHATQVASGLPVFTVHAVVDDECFHDGHLMSLLDEMQSCLAGHFDVEHSTIQFEPASHADHERAAHH